MSQWCFYLRNVFDLSVVTSDVLLGLDSHARRNNGFTAVELKLPDWKTQSTDDKSSTQQSALANDRLVTHDQRLPGEEHRNEQLLTCWLGLLTTAKWRIAVKTKLKACHPAMTQGHKPHRRRTCWRIEEYQKLNVMNHWWQMMTWCRCLDEIIKLQDPDTTHRSQTNAGKPSACSQPSKPGCRNAVVLLRICIRTFRLNVHV